MKALKVAGGAVTLEGEVQSWLEREEAESAVWAAPSVTPPMNRSDHHTLLRLMLRALLLCHGELLKQRATAPLCCRRTHARSVSDASLHGDLFWLGRRRLGLGDMNGKNSVLALAANSI